MSRTEHNPGWRILNAGAFMDEIGPLQSMRNDSGAAQYELRTDHRHVNAIGLIHGGVISALLDQVIAVEAWNAAGRVPTMTVQIETRFLAPVQPGAYLRATVQMRHRAGSLMYLDAEVTTGSKPVALASAIMKVSGKVNASA